MLAIQCKLCGGDIEIAPGADIGTCAYCGNANTYPKTEDENKIITFNNANNLRREGRFDDALEIYEKMLEEDRNDAELHWCCALARFGVVYKEDSTTFEWVPTCHRTGIENFLEDADYLAAIHNFHGIEQRRCQQDAEKIAEVERMIRQGTQDVPEYDLFLTCCVKGADGSTAKDRLRAQNIYEQLKKRGYQIFFPPVDLEDKNGLQVESYLYGALNTSKAMIVVGTSEDNINDTWVKNDWIRFLNMGTKKQNSPVVVCYEDMKKGQIPKELSGAPSCDMEKETFLNDLFKELNKVLTKKIPMIDSEPLKKPVSAPEPIQKPELQREPISESVIEPNPVIEPELPVAPKLAVEPEPEPIIPEPEPEPEISIEELLQQGYELLAEKQWKKADGLFEQVLIRQPNSGRAYFGEFLSANECISDEDFARGIQNKMALQQSEFIPFVCDIQKEVQEAVGKYQISYYLEADRISEELAFSDGYNSCTKNQEEYYEKIKTLIETDTLLARARRDDTEYFGTALNTFLEKILNDMLESVERSRTKDAQNQTKVQQRYEKHLADKKEVLEQLYQEALDTQSKEYTDACSRISEARTTEEYQELMKIFEKLSGYKNANQFKAHCENKISNAEMAGKKEKQKKTMFVCGGVVVLVALLAVIFLPKFVRYRKAVGLYNSGDYGEAVTAFKELGSYMSSEKKKEESLEKRIDQLEQQKSFSEAQQLIQDNYNGWDQDQALQQCYVAEAEVTSADTATNVSNLEKLMEQIKDEKTQESIQEKLDDYYYAKGNEAAGLGNFNSALDFYKKVKSSNSKKADAMETLIEETMNNPLYQYADGVTWKLDSCVYNGKQSKQDSTGFAGVHVRLTEDSAVFYVTFDNTNIDLKSNVNISNIKVKSGGLKYTLQFNGQNLTISGKDAKKKKVVSKLNCK